MQLALVKVLLIMFDPQARKSKKLSHQLRQKTNTILLMSAVRCGPTLRKELMKSRLSIPKMKNSVSNYVLLNIKLVQKSLNLNLKPKPKYLWAVPRTERILLYMEYGV